MSVHEPIPLLRPQLPTADDLLPFLRQIDARAWYSNFGPLHDKLLGRLVAAQRQRSGRPVHAVLTCNGTLALELMLADLRLQPGSRVAIPALTFIATATAVTRCGLQPVAIDVDTDTWLLTPACMPADPAAHGIAAVVPVAGWGLATDADAWERWFLHTGIPVCTDAAGAWGSQQTRAHVPAMISLHATKSLSTGEGGLVLTESVDAAERIRAATCFGDPANPSTTNAKLTEYQAAIGLAHLTLWPEQARRRVDIHSRYRASLSGALGDLLSFQQGSGSGAATMLAVALRDGNLRQSVERECHRHAIETRRWYGPPVNRQAHVHDLLMGEALPNAERLYESILCLPMFPAMTDSEVDRVCAVVRMACETNDLRCASAATGA